MASTLPAVAEQLLVARVTTALGFSLLVPVRRVLLGLLGEGRRLPHWHLRCPRLALVLHAYSCLHRHPTPWGPSKGTARVVGRGCGTASCTKGRGDSF